MFSKSASFTFASGLYMVPYFFSKYTKFHSIFKIILFFLQNENPLKPLNTILDAIKYNQSIYELTITHGISVDSAMVRRLLSEHPVLVKLTLWCQDLVANDAIGLIRQLNSLEHFKFLMLPSEYTKLLSFPLDESEWIFVDHDWGSVVSITLSR